MLYPSFNYLGSGHVGSYGYSLINNMNQNLKRKKNEKKQTINSQVKQLVSLDWLFCCLFRPWGIPDIQKQQQRTNNAIKTSYHHTFPRRNVFCFDKMVPRDVTMRKSQLQPLQSWAESDPLSWYRVKVSENLVVTLVTPVITPLVPYTDYTAYLGKDV